jgi:Flp pilus assembly protein CpaB
MRENKFVLMALAIAIITGLLTFQFLNNLNKREYIVVAKSDIPQYRLIDSSLVELKAIHPTGMQPDAVRSVQSIVGTYAQAHIAKGEHLLNSKISHLGDDKDFAGKLESDERAIFIPINIKQGLGGAINREDFVDVIFVSFEGRLGFNVSKTILQRVLVLDVRNDSGQSIYDSERWEAPSGVIVALSLNDSEKIAYCLENGEIYIARHPIMGDRIRTEGIFYENVYKDI